MARLRIEPAGVEVLVEDGETVLDAATRAGLSWRSLCGGHAECRTCFFTVRSDPAALSPMARREADALSLVAPTLAALGPARLACQARVTADAVIYKVGVRARQSPAS